MVVFPDYSLPRRQAKHLYFYLISIWLYFHPIILDRTSPVPVLKGIDLQRLKKPYRQSGLILVPFYHI